MIAARFARELHEISAARQVSAQELIGRQSGNTLYSAFQSFIYSIEYLVGSLEWRTSRGETGDGAAERPKPVTALPVVQARKIHFTGAAFAERCSLVGSARFVGQQIQLTAQENDQRGAVWFRQQLAAQSSFCVEFSFIIKQSGADGMALVFQQHSLSALGEGGSGLGYQGIPKSVAVEIDTYPSIAGFNDPNGNHISVHTRGINPNSADHQFSRGCTNCLLPPLSNDTEYLCLVVVDSRRRQLTVSLTDSKCTSAAANDGGFRGDNYLRVLEIDDFSLQKYLCGSDDAPLADGDFWCGFTAATGGVNQSHQVTYCSLWLL